MSLKCELVMALLLQHLLVVSLAAGCAGVVGWQVINTFRGRKSRVGSCCATGCGGTEKRAEEPPMVFFPVDSLSRKRR